MKEMFFFLYLILGAQLNAQADWVGNDVKLYEGVEFRVKPKKDAAAKKGDYEGFWRQPKRFTDTILQRTNVIFNNSRGLSKHDSLVGRKFKCQSVSPYYDLYFMRLVNDSIGTVFYLFDADSPHKFDLEPIGEIKVPEGYFCEKITTHEDKFEGSTYYSSPLLEPVFFEKVTVKGKSYYYIRLDTYGATPSRGKGVWILLSDGQRIIRPSESNDVDVRNMGGYYHSVYFELTAAEVTQLQKYQITDFRIFIYEEVDVPGKKYQEYLKCLVNGK